MTKECVAARAEALGGGCLLSSLTSRRGKHLKPKTNAGGGKAARWSMLRLTTTLREVRKRQRSERRRTSRCDLSHLGAAAPPSRTRLCAISAQSLRNLGGALGVEEDDAFELK